MNRLLSSILLGSLLAVLTGRGALGDDPAAANEDLETRTHELRTAETIEAALALARSELARLETAHGPGHWRVREARFVLELNETIASLEPGSRAKFAAIERELAGAFERIEKRDCESGAQRLEVCRARIEELLGSEHVLSLSVVADIAPGLFRCGQADRARTLLERAVAAAGAPAIPARLRVRLGRSLASLEGARGEFETARKLLETTRAVALEHLGMTDPETGLVLNDLGIVQRRLDRFTDAIESYLQALAIYESAHGTRHAVIAQTLSNIASVHMRLSDFESAEQFARRALEMVRALGGEEQQLAGFAYFQLAWAVQYRGDLLRAERLFRRALEIHRRVLGPTHRGTLHCHGALSGNLSQQGRDVEALELMQEVLEQRIERLGPTDVDVGLSHQNIAGRLVSLWRLTEAELHARKALSIAQGIFGEKNSEVLSCRLTLAEILVDQGRLDEAEAMLRDLLERARSLQGELSTTFVGAANALALALQEKGETEEAGKLLRRSLALERELGRKAEAMVVAENLAIFLADHGDRREAERLMREIVADTEREFGPNHESLVPRLRNLAVALSRNEKQDESEAAVRRALEIVPARSIIERGKCLTELAHPLYFRGRLAEAEALLEEAATLFETSRARISARRFARVTMVSPYDLLVCTRARLGQHAAAWRSLERLRARALQDAAASRRELSTVDRRREQELSVALQQAQEALGERRDSGRAARLEALGRAALELAEFERAMERKYGVSAQEPFPRERIQRALTSRQAIVAWVSSRLLRGSGFPTGDHWALVLRSEGDPVCVPLPGSAGEGWTDDDIERLRDLRKSLVEGKDGRIVARGLEQSRSLLVAPLERHLGKTDRLPAAEEIIVIPSRLTGGLPVELLFGSRTITRAPSGSAYAWLVEKRHTAPRRPSLLAVGDPILRSESDAGSARARLEPLEYARHEVETIAALFRRDVAADPHVLLGSSASEDSLEKLRATGQLARFSHVHIATHGLVNTTSPFQSALILSPPRSLESPTSFDGRLTAEQILRTWRLDADLVTLSACDTALGKVTGTEGDLGFSQALLLAGARSVVLSLWKVPDDATALLMAKFYTLLLDGKQGRAAALRQAKEWLRGLEPRQIERLLAAGKKATAGPDTVAAARGLSGGRRRTDFSHPSVWSAFVLVGDGS